MMNRIQRWQRWGIGLLLGIALCWMIGCVSPNSQTANQRSLEFWTMQLQPKFSEYLSDLIVEFEAAHPETSVRWVDVPWAAMESKILAAVSAKTGPDVANLNPNFAALLAERKAWLDLDARVPDVLRQQYFPNIWKASVLDDLTFGIPWYITTRITIYNTQILQEAGISQAPSTYEELAQVARQVKEKTGKPAFFATFVPEDSAEVLESLVQMGVELVDEAGKAAFDTAAGKAAFQYWVDLYQQGLLPREVLTQGHQRAIELYQAGEIAILASGPQFVRTIAQNAPTIAAVSAIAPQITGQNGKKAVAVMNLVIPRDTPNPDAAIAFALFVTNPDNQLAFSQLANTLPSTQTTLDDPYFHHLPPDASSVEKARVISASQLPDAAVLVPPMKNVNRLQQIIYDNLQGAMLGEKTVDEALSDAAKTWDRLQF